MKDRFSDRSKAYAVFRPTYPQELYRFVLGHTAGRQRAWDVGTGNGQVARVLASHFDHVLATDVSEQQLKEAPAISNVSYERASASRCPAEDQSIDLITVGQALHWFSFSEFFTEVERVARPGATLAVWGYSLCSVSPEIDPVLRHFYERVVGPFWDAERKYVDEHYRTLHFPPHWHEIPPAHFAMSFEWTLDQFSGYLSTWSAVRNYVKANQADPVAPVIHEIKPDWGHSKAILFPLFLRIFKIT